MPNTTAYSFGDVVLVPFPFTDQSASKKRPAVIVSTDAYHQRRPDVIVMAVTSQILRPAGALGEVLIREVTLALLYGDAAHQYRPRACGTKILGANVRHAVRRADHLDPLRRSQAVRGSPHRVVRGD